MVNSSKRSKKSAAFLRAVLVIASVFLLNFIGAYIHGRLDLTAEKRYSVADETRKRLENLKDVVLIKVYLEGDFPPGFQKLKSGVNDLLSEYRNISGGKVDFEFINPAESGLNSEGTNEVYKELYRKGLLPTDLQVGQEGGGMERKIIWPGALLVHRGKEVAINFLRGQSGAGTPLEVINRSEENLEYEFTNAIRKVSVNEKPKVAFVSGQGEFASKYVADISQELNEFYDVERYRLGRAEPIPSEYKCIIVAKPDSVFSDWAKFKLDQYIMNGGRVLWLIDGTAANMDSLQGNPAFLAMPLELGLGEMFFKYGFRINNDLVQDIKSSQIPVIVGSFNGKPQQKLFPWFYYPLVSTDNEHPLVRNLDPIQLQFAGTIDLIENDIKKTVLLKTSRYTKVLYAPTRVNLSIIKEAPNPTQFNKPFQNVAVLLEGEFESFYKNRLMLGFAENVLDSMGLKQISRSPANRMIVVSDGDVIGNYVTKKSENMFPLGYDRFSGQTYGNKYFMLNCVDYLASDDGMIGLRSRELKLRMLNQQKVKAEKIIWQVINIGLPLVLLTLFGVYYAWRRRKKFAK